MLPLQVDIIWYCPCLNLRDLDGSLPFHDGGRHHIETSPLICSTNQWAGFSMITAAVMKWLNDVNFTKVNIHFCQRNSFLEISNEDLVGQS